VCHRTIIIFARSVPYLKYDHIIHRKHCREAGLYWTAVTAICRNCHPRVSSQVRNPSRSGPTAALLNAISTRKASAGPRLCPSKFRSNTDPTLIIPFSTRLLYAATYSAIVFCRFPVGLRENTQTSSSQSILTANLTFGHYPFFPQMQSQIPNPDRKKLAPLTQRLQGGQALACLGGLPSVTRTAY